MMRLHLRKAGEEPGVLVLIRPFQVLEECYRTAKRIEEIDDR